MPLFLGHTYENLTPPNEKVSRRKPSILNSTIFLATSYIQDTTFILNLIFYSLFDNGQLNIFFGV